MQPNHNVQKSQKLNPAGAGGHKTLMCRENALFSAVLLHVSLWTSRKFLHISFKTEPSLTCSWVSSGTNRDSHSRDTWMSLGTALGRVWRLRRQI